MSQTPFPGLAGVGYEVVYGVQLFDDLHNYLPELLYNQGRFQTVAQVFHYIRTQMSSRFNLFARGTALYNETQPITVTTTLPVFTGQNVTGNVGIPRGQTPFIPTPRTPVPTTNTTTTNLLMALLGMGGDLGLGGMGGMGGFGIQEQLLFPPPVVIRPTADVLAQNTELIDGNSLPDIVTAACAICQDAIGPNDVCRRLRPCRHVYHRTCIDQWFERSVFCPTCRHDIRNSNEPTAANEPGETQ